MERATAIQPASEVTAPTAGPATCEHCEQGAAYTAIWPWGKEEHVCQRHVIIIHQRAKALKQQATIVQRLDGPRPAPSRDERARLQGEILVRDADLAEVRARGIELYNKNVALTAEVQRLTVLNRELERKRADAVADAQEAAAKAEAATVELGAMTDERNRLRTLIESSDRD